jgi:fucose permease
MPTASRNKRTLLILTAWGIFFAMGTFLGAIGPALPEISRHTGEPLEVIGTLFTAVFIGTLIAQLASGQIVDRFGARSIVIIGCVMALTGIAGLILSGSLLLILLFGVVVGASAGFMDVATQVYISAAYTRSSLRALNSLHLFYGVGTVAGPIFVSLTLRLLESSVAALWVAGVLPALLIPLVWWLYDDSVLSTQRDSNAKTSSRQIYTAPLVWLLGLLLLFYVGLEAGVGGWTTVYMTSTTGMIEADAALVTSLYWLAFTVGRFLATIGGSRVDAMPMLLISVVAQLIGSALVILGFGDTLLTVLGTLVVGLGAAPVYGTVMSVATRSFPGGRGRAVSFVAALGSVGGLIITPLQGVVIERLGPVWNGWYMVLISAVMVGFFALIRTLVRRRVPVPA